MNFLKDDKSRAIIMLVLALLVIAIAAFKLDGFGKLIAFFVAGLMGITSLVKLIYSTAIDNKAMSVAETNNVLVKKKKALSMPYLFLPFLFVGFILTAGFVNEAFNYKQYDDVLVDLGEADIPEDLELEPPPTQQKPPPPPPPPPPPEIEIVEDEEIIEEEPEILDEIVEEETVVDIKEAIPDAPIEDIAEEVFSEPEIFTVVEDMPTFPGGDAELYKYLGKNIKYPKIAKQNGLEGKVFVQFVVNEDGSISDVQVLRDVGGGTGAEAMRVIKGMPRWTPGKQRGQAVKVRYTVPVNFKLQ